MANVNLPAISTSEWQLIKEQASMAVKSRLLPSSVDTPEKAAIIALKGKELGIPIMQALAGITVIQGKPALSAELMLALIYKHCPGAQVNIIESTNEKCSMEFCRPKGKPYTLSFTMEDAKRAGLANNQSWQKYPQALLRARTISAGARAIFPDALMGASYTPEELGAEITITEDGGEVITTNEPTAQPKQTQYVETVQAPTENKPKSTQTGNISEPQRRRLLAIVSKNKWTYGQVKEFIFDRWEIDSSKNLDQTQYQTLCEFIEAHPHTQLLQQEGTGSSA